MVWVQETVMMCRKLALFAEKVSVTVHTSATSLRCMSRVVASKAFNSNSGTFLHFSPRPLLPSFLSLLICDCQSRGPAFSVKIFDFGVGETAKTTIFDVLFKQSETVTGPSDNPNSKIIKHFVARH